MKTIFKSPRYASVEMVQYIGQGPQQYRIVWGMYEEFEGGPGCCVFFRPCNRDHAAVWLRAMRATYLKELDEERERRREEEYFEAIDSKNGSPDW